MAVLGVSVVVLEGREGRWEGIFGGVAGTELLA